MLDWTSSPNLAVTKTFTWTSSSLDLGENRFGHGVWMTSILKFLEWRVAARGLQKWYLLI